MIFEGCQDLRLMRILGEHQRVLSELVAPPGIGSLGEQDFYDFGMAIR